MKLLIKFDRLVAWVLFASMVLFFISGYGMTKGIITNSLAINIHNKILPPIVIVAFVTHAWYAIHLAFKRWKIWNWFSKIMLAAFFIAFFGYFGYLQYFYQQPIASSSQTIDTDDSVTEQTSNNSISSSRTTKTFTLSELSKYNGKNGQPAYVSVDGKVYDLTGVFASGKHYTHFAGSELTNAFYSYHAARSLAKYPVVGTLVK